MRKRHLIALLRKIDASSETICRFRRIVVALAISGKLDSDISGITETRDFLDTAFNPSSDGLSCKQITNRLVLPTGMAAIGRFVRLGEIARIEKGKTGIKQAQPGSFPLVVTAADRLTCNHFDFEGAATIVPLVSSTGHGKASIHRLHYQEGQFALGSILAAIFPNKPDMISPRFLFEYLSTFKEDLLVSQMIGTANVSLSVEKISNVGIPLISNSAQRKVDEIMALCDQLERERAEREKVRDKLTAATLARLNTPNPESFHSDARFALVNFQTLTKRQDQIKQLRQVLIELAVTGKLVPQLLKHERVAEQYANEPKAPDLPENWHLINFEKYCDIAGGNQPPKSQFVGEPRDGYVQLLQIRDLGENPVPTYIPANSTNRFCKEGEILIGRYGASVGKIFWARNGAYNVALAKFLWPEDALISRFVFLLLKSHYFQASLAGATRSAQAGFNKGDLAAIEFPCPPLEEQQRIVARVDELMSILDALELALVAGDEAQGRLFDALLSESLKSPSEPRNTQGGESDAIPAIPQRKRAS